MIELLLNVSEVLRGDLRGNALRQSSLNLGRESVNGRLLIAAGKPECEEKNGECVAHEELSLQKFGGSGAQQGGRRTHCGES